MTAQTEVFGKRRLHRTISYKSLRSPSQNSYYDDYTISDLNFELSQGAIIMNKFPTILFCVIMLLSLLLMISCQTTTKPKTGSISGSVILVNDTGDQAYDPNDFSGVSIALYDVAELDTSLVRINNEYPQIGVQICQETEFDHRDYNPIKTVSSDETGNFRFDSTPNGTYNLVFMSEVWGVRYEYNVEVASNESTNVGDIELYPVTDMSSTVENITFKSFHHYIVSHDVSVTGNAVFEPNALISIGYACNLRFFGSVLTTESSDPSQAWKINAERGIFTTVQSPVETTDYYNSVAFYCNPTNLSSGIINHAGNSVALFGSTSNLKYIYCKDFNTALTINHSQTLIENTVINNGLSSGIDATNETQTVQVSKCIFYKQANAIFVYSPSGYNVNNCYFIDNEYGIRPDFSAGTITQNAFERNKWDILQYQVFNASMITYNNFYYSTHLTVYPRKNAIINNNNFFKTDWFFIDLRHDVPPYSIVFNNLDATNNYWGVADIDAYIRDANDNGDFPTQPCPNYVIYLPKRSNRITDAGIQ